MNKLKQIRTELNLTQAEISKHLKITQSVWSLYETETLPVSKNVVLELQKKFNVNPRFFYDENATMFEEQPKTQISSEERIAKVLTIYSQLNSYNKGLVDNLIDAILAIALEFNKNQTQE